MSTPDNAGDDRHGGERPTGGGPDGSPYGNHVDDTYDVVVLGSGSAGEVVAGELSRAGRRVVVVESGLVGGECPYLACIPSKAMLLAARRHRAEHLDGGPEDHAAGWARAVATRDRVAAHRDDSGHAAAMIEDGIDLVRGTGVVTAPGTVTVTGDGGERRLRWRQALVLATGSAAVVPPLEGLDRAAYWTSDDALSCDELPGRLALLGGGAIGCELAQIYAGFGSRVTLLEAADALLPREPGWLGDELADVLRGWGVDVRTGAEVSAVEPVAGGRRGAVLVRLAEGAPLTADRLLVAVGKRPRTAGLGLEVLGLSAGDVEHLGVDARCRVLSGGRPMPDVFAAGDVTNQAMYTHFANAQGRTVAAELLGRGRDADATGVPRAVYTDPAVLCAGITPEQARDGGLDVLTADFDVTRTSRSAVERSLDPDDDRPARVQLVADAATGELVGFAAIGPEADSWAAELALAVRARMSVRTLADHAHAFPSWLEGVHPPARELAERVRARPAGNLEPRSA